MMIILILPFKSIVGSEPPLCFKRMCPQSFVLTLSSIVFYYKIIYESLMKYLIRIWHGDNLIKDLTWESDDEDKLYREVAESVPKNYRVTIENDKREDKNAR
jgi:hypothetical protein